MKLEEFNLNTKKKTHNFQTKTIKMKTRNNNIGIQFLRHPSQKKWYCHLMCSVSSDSFYLHTPQFQTFYQYFFQYFRKTRIVIRNQPNKKKTKRNKKEKKKNQINKLENATNSYKM